MVLIQWLLHHILTALYSMCYFYQVCLSELDPNSCFSLILYSNWCAVSTYRKPLIGKLMVAEKRRLVEAMKFKFHLPVNSSVLGVVLHRCAVFDLVDPRNWKGVSPTKCLPEASKLKVSPDCELLGLHTHTQLFEWTPLCQGTSLWKRLGSSEQFA